MGNRKGRSEASLVGQLKHHFEKQGLLTATELSLGYGRADLVAYRINIDGCRARLDNGQHRSLNRVEHYTLLRLLPDTDTGESLPLAYLSANLSFSPSHLRRSLLSYLIRFGYAVEVEHHQYAKINGFVPISHEILAIEAKVADWRRGAIQAKRYQLFANRVYLGISVEYSHRVDPAILEKHNIGLLTIGREVTEVLSAPRLSPRDCDRFNFASEWLWRYRRRDIRRMVTNA